MCNDEVEVSEYGGRSEDLIPQFKFLKSEEALLKNDVLKIKRCSKCILPETMPFIEFDDDGICNYCNNYELQETTQGHRRNCSILLDLIDEQMRMTVSCRFPAVVIVVMVCI